MNSSQYSDQEVLASLFGSRARVEVLRVFCIDPRRAYYQRQLEAATGLPIRAVQRELERLVSIDLLYRRMEGNRAYYQIDPDFSLFSELRELFLKAGHDVDRLRAQLAQEDSVRLAFLREEDRRVLVVTVNGQGTVVPESRSFEFEVMASEAFLRALAESPETLEPFLGEGVDLLGRRDDTVWRRIGIAGFTVEKGKGIP